MPTDTVGISLINAAPCIFLDAQRLLYPSEWMHISYRSNEATFTRHAFVQNGYCLNFSFEPSNVVTWAYMNPSLVT